MDKTTIESCVTRFVDDLLKTVVSTRISDLAETPRTIKRVRPKAKKPAGRRFVTIGELTPKPSKAMAKATTSPKKVRIEEDFNGVKKIFSADVDGYTYIRTERNKLVKALKDKGFVVVNA
jgi:hypothetical protein